MSTIISTVTTDVFLRTIVNITTSIISTNALYKWFLEHKNNDYLIYQNKIISTDLNNKLSVVSALIKDIINKYYIHCDGNINTIINEFIENSKNLETIDSVDNIDSVNSTNSIDDHYAVINYSENCNITIKIPEALKIALLSTLEIINIINKELFKLQNKITNHKKSYSSMLYSINIEYEINSIYCNSLLFEKRIDIFFKVINMYNALIINK